MKRLPGFASTLIFAFPATLLCAQSQTAIYLDPAQPAAVRAHDVVSKMTLDEKAAQLEDWATAIPRLGIPDYQTWSEALHGVANSGYATVFPPGYWHGCYLESGPGKTDGGHHFYRRSSQV